MITRSTSGTYPLSLSGRRWQRLLEQSRWRWLVTNEGPNRHERRKYLVQLRRRAAEEAKKKAKEKRFVVTPDSEG